MRSHVLRCLPESIGPVPEVLLHFDGSNNGTSFTNTGAWARTVTVFGDTRLTTSHKVFGTASAAFDGGGDYARIGVAGDVDLIGSSFTVEFRVRLESNKSFTRFFALGGGSASFNSTTGIHLLIQRQQGTGTNRLNVQWWNGTAGVNVNSPVDSIANLAQWYAISLSVDHAEGKAWVGVDGVVTEHSWSGVRPSAAPICELGSIPGEDGFSTIGLDGQIDELRIVKGQALYRANYSPATAAFPNPTDQESNNYAAESYADAVETADGQMLEPGVKAAYLAFIAGCRSDGLLSKISACCILAGARTVGGALQPLLGPAPTNVSNLFVSGDYNRETGLVGNGSSKYLNANVPHNANGITDHHLSVYISSVASGTMSYIGAGAFGAGSYTTGIYRNVSGTDRLDVRSRGSTNNGGSPTATGFAGISRGGPTTFTARVAAGDTTISDSSFSGAGSESFAVFARNTTTPGLFSDARIAFYSVGADLALSDLQSRVDTLLADIAAAIP
jgi:hypothetical protein